MVGQPPQTSPRYGILITTVDPAQGLIRGVMKGDAQERPILVMEVPNAFRWPREGESWMVMQKNGTWYLEGGIPSQSALVRLHDVPTGDLILTSPTGTVRVMGSDDGSTDFVFNQKSFPRRAPALGFGGALSIVHKRANGVSTTTKPPLVLTL